MPALISAKTLTLCFLLTGLLTAGIAAAAPETAVLNELWRAGGEDDEIFFGSVAAIRTDGDGNILILDGQLSEVHVYSPEGEHLRTVFREGDGPGEVRRPNDMFVTEDGTICVLTGFPGKIVKVSADGLPAGQTSFARGEKSQVPMGVLNRGFDLPEGILLVGIRMTFNAAITNQTYFLSLCADDGLEKTALVEKNSDVDYSEFIMTEAGLDFVWNRVAVGPGGHIYVAPERNTYEIKVFDKSGAQVGSFSHPYEQSPRTGDEKKAAKQILEAVAAYYPRPPIRYEVEDTAAVVAGMWVTADGRLWVQTGDAHQAAPEGAWVILDVFSPEGEFEKQVALPGGYDAQQDALFVQPDGLVIVVVGALDAFLNQQAVSSDEGGGESTAQPLEVICYRMDH
jgi:hypothetical protein